MDSLCHEFNEERRHTDERGAGDYEKPTATRVPVQWRIAFLAILKNGDIDGIELAIAVEVSGVVVHVSIHPGL